MTRNAAAPSIIETRPIAAPPSRYPLPDFDRLTASWTEGRDLARDVVAWRDLSDRSLEPNVFFDPDFLLPLLETGGSRVALLQVWEDDGPASFGRLVGLFPLVRRRLGWRTLHGFAHPQIACGTPLIDRDRASEVVACALDRLAGDPTGCAALTLHAVPRDGAFQAILDEVCRSSGRSLNVVESHARAMLSHRDAPAPAGSAKRRKEHARQLRRLSEVGAISYRSARTPQEVAAALETFMTLEAAGWKGRRGTAFLADAALATFARTMAAGLAAAGRCRIDALQVAGSPVAMGIVLRAVDRDYFWKTAFDERHADLSPGVHFTVALTAAQCAETSTRMTDSCAVADHPMIDRIWPERIVVADLMVATRPDGAARLARAVRVERLRRDLRQRIKALWLKMRGRAH